MKTMTIIRTWIRPSPSCWNRKACIHTGLPPGPGHSALVNLSSQPVNAKLRHMKMKYILSIYVWDNLIPFTYFFFHKSILKLWRQIKYKLSNRLSSSNGNQSNHLKTLTLWMVLKSTCQLPIILTFTILKYGVSFCLLLFTDRKVNKEEKQPCPLVTKAYYFSEKKILKVFIASNWKLSYLPDQHQQIWIS